MKKKEPKVQYGRSYRYGSAEQAIKDLLKLQKKQQAEKAKKVEETGRPSDGER